MATRWLFKTEPSVYSYQQLVKDKSTRWDGVANNLALMHLKDIKKGDQIFIYHTGDERQAVGIARASGRRLLRSGKGQSAHAGGRHRAGESVGQAGDLGAGQSRQEARQIRSRAQFALVDHEAHRGTVGRDDGDVEEVREQIGETRHEA